MVKTRAQTSDNKVKRVPFGVVRDGRARDENSMSNPVVVFPLEKKTNGRKRKIEKDPSNCLSTHTKKRSSTRGQGPLAVVSEGAAPSSSIVRDSSAVAKSAIERATDPYAVDLLATYLERQKRISAYCSWNPERVGNKREKAVRRIFDEAEGRGFRRETVHLAVGLMDRYALTPKRHAKEWAKMCDETSSRAAFFIASKFEEKSYDAPSVKSLATAATSKQNLIKEETELLESLNYDLRFPTVLEFINVAFLFMSKLDSKGKVLRRKPPPLVRFLCDFVLSLPEFLSLKPSDVALVCLALGGADENENDQKFETLDQKLLDRFNTSKDDLLFPAVNLHRRVRDARAQKKIDFIFDLYEDEIDWEHAFANMKSKLRSLHQS